ncbi:hypothetical protein [Leptolyngbya sp. O-77]|uniref:hypothetical protein n=1 Tax=Leptolyngbya sp. O-77 TaxID=1080068 RepID=UPI00074D3B57|nr:hypothetical protein [Leptolyngbya sp. O-77]BAU42136.1 hypothetical protein O77CONTIG1_01954 [Leptolyngbya sp. O-77]BAU43077.1 hypothetical protein O77CONTIG1_02899 [Leptolyngbya sp. O-77]
MLTIQYTWSSPASEATQFSLPPLTCELPRRRRLRLYLVGSPADTQQEVDRLHLLRYAERFEWSRSVPIAENGILIQPDAGDVLRYLQRNR